MKIALQTTPWGPVINLPDLLAHAARLGYHGVEFSQPVNSLGPAHHIKLLLARHNLELVGLVGGQIETRLRYAMEIRPDYIYANEWDEKPILRSLENGIPVALHPHLYKTIQTVGDAEHYLTSLPGLRLILDTAHSYLAGDDIFAALAKHQNRVVAVYLKDWTHRYGRSPLRFARGFTSLGQGDLGELLKATVTHLLKSNYQGWVIVEQDTTQGNLVERASNARDWLRSNGL